MSDLGDTRAGEAYTVTRTIEHSWAPITWFMVKGPGVSLGFDNKDRAAMVANALNTAYFEGLKAAEKQ